MTPLERVLLSVYRPTRPVTPEHALTGTHPQVVDNSVERMWILVDEAGVCKK